MEEYISTLCMGREVHLVWKPAREKITDFLTQGFVPIEMAEGQESIVDFRCLDHHNAYSHSPSACVTALKYYGTLENPAKFMVNHTDADCVLTGLTLMGLLPLDFLETFNTEVGLLDTDPLGTDLSQLVHRDAIRLWKTGMASIKQSGWSWLYGLQLFLDVLRNAEAYSEIKFGLEERERARVQTAMEDREKATRGASGKTLLVAPSRVHGFDVQFERQREFPADSLDGWRYWCIAAYVEKAGNVTLSCPNARVAEAAFGSSGLMNVYPKLPAMKEGEWGGREAVGGSPRGARITSEMLPEILKTVDAALVAIKA